MSASRPPSADLSGDQDGGDRSGLAWGKSPNRGPAVVGRESELAALADLLADARSGRTAALVLAGEPGIGKTTLLETARRSATGFRCLRATGVESESVLAYAGLLQLLTPVRSRIGDLPAGQRTALAQALGWDSTTVPTERFRVSGALLSVLAAVADDGPLLVLVDDLQWLDRESVDALLFAVRRLGDVSVCFLLATRTTDPTDGTWAGPRSLTLTGLSTAASRQLVGADMSDQVLGRVVDQTGGNPLAIIEVSRALTHPQRVGAAALPATAPVGRRLLQVYAQRCESLSAARRALLLLALNLSGDPTVVATALELDGHDPAAAVDEALDHGLLVRHGSQLTFGHPLIRAAVVESSPAAERRAAHGALADALATRRGPGPAQVAETWHRAEAAAGPDQQVAADLAGTAGWSRARHGYAAAAEALERAAGLTDSPGGRADWLAAAAADAFLAGDTARVRSLAARVLDSTAAQPAARGQVLFTLGMVEQYAGSVPRALELLAPAVELVHPRSRTRAIAELALARFRLNDVAGMAECAAAIWSTVQAEDPLQPMLADFTRGVSAVLGGDPVGGAVLLTAVIARIGVPPLRDEPQSLPFLALAAGFVGDVKGIAELATYQLDLARERGALGVLVPSLALIAAGRAWLGDHAGAFADAGEAAELGDQLGYAADTAVAVEMLAWQSAARGFHQAADVAMRRAKTLTDRAGTTEFAAHQAITAAFCALCRGDAAEVVAVLEGRLVADGGVGSMGEPLGVAPDLVEAYALLGRLDQARDLAQRFADVTPVAAAPGVRAMVARCRGLTAADARASRAAFEEALAAHARAPDPFLTSRTRLLYGARLRRDGRRVQAREQLRAAYDAFSAMDLTVWAERAAGELAATGATVRSRAPQVTEPLTSQETRVALQAARGLSNKQIAAALFLSPKTVEHHLSSVYRKRGYRSRAELAATFRAPEVD